MRSDDKGSNVSSCSSKHGIQCWWRLQKYQHDRIMQGSVANFGKNSQIIKSDSKVKHGW